MIAVVLVNFNGMDDSVECLNSLANCRPRPRVVVVDNASSSDEAERLASLFPWATVIKSSENLGWAGGNNLGIRECLSPQSIEAIGRPPNCTKADIVLLLNNDTIVHPELISSVLDGITCGYGIVGPVINEFYDREVVQSEGVRFNGNGSSGFFEPVSVRGKTDAIIPTDIVNGCAVAIHRDVFDKIGMIDERFFLICEESDFCLRALDAGFRLGIINRSLVWHKHSVSFKRAGKPLQRYYGSRNLWLLLRKHPNGRGRRNRFNSTMTYFRHCFHIFSHELEQNNAAGADAIAEGLSDALLGRFGKRGDSKSMLYYPIRYGLLGAFQLNSLRQRLGSR